MKSNLQLGRDEPNQSMHACIQRRSIPYAREKAKVLTLSKKDEEDELGVVGAGGTLLLLVVALGLLLARVSPTIGALTAGSSSRTRRRCLDGQRRGRPPGWRAGRGM